MLQETRKEFKDTTAYSYWNKLRKNNQGGGITVGIHRQLQARDLSELIPDQFN